MSKYRIVRRWYSTDSYTYDVQYRVFLFFWERERSYGLLSEAKECVAKMIEDEKKPKDEIVYEG